MLKNTDIKNMSTRTTKPKKYSRGLSMIELLVGVAIGLFLLAGASSLLVSTATSSRSLINEARLNQNLRAATDLITRDLRRASFWENAVAGTTTLNTATTINPYAVIAASPASSTVVYSFSRDFAANRTSIADKDTSTVDEQFGFRLLNGAVEMQVGGWQSITDPSIVNVTNLEIVPVETFLDVKDSCSNMCCDAITGTCLTTNVTTPPGCPKLNVRRYDISITGQSSKDLAVVRNLRTSVRVRNDSPVGSCPN